MNNLSKREEILQLLNDPSIVLEELKKIKKLGKEKGEMALNKNESDIEKLEIKEIREFVADMF